MTIALFGATIAYMRLKDIDDSAFEDWVEERTTYAPKPRKRLQFKTDDFCDSKPWRELRAKVIDFYGRQCMKCKGVGDIIQVDHIKPKSLYPELALDFRNMQVLCIHCNKDKGQVTADYRSKLDKFRFNIP